jgi:queuine/archaeosine tRNA-ribosyltransferase
MGKTRYNRSYDYEDRFSEKDLPNLENVKSDSEKESSILAEVCDLCNKFTQNILHHLKKCHPIEFQKMLES